MSSQSGGDAQSLFSGPPGFPAVAAAQPPPRPLVTLALALAIFAGGILVGGLVQTGYVSIGGLARETDGRAALAAGLVWLIAMQATIIVLTLLAASWSGVPAALRLHLVQPPQGPKVYLQAFGVMICGVAIYNAIAYAVGATDIVTDLRVFIDMSRSPAWGAALIAIGIGAPAFEELLFRGFLLPGLAASPIRFRGAALATTAIWTVLHVGYSVAGLIEVALVGLYLSWVLWRTGSVWVTLFCHAAYNTALMMALLAWPKPV